MTHNEILGLIDRHLGVPFYGVRRFLDPTDIGHQFGIEKPTANPGDFYDWQHLWWRTNENGVLTHCAFFDCSSGTDFFIPAPETGSPVRFGEALSQGWQFNSREEFSFPAAVGAAGRVEWFHDDFRSLIQSVLTLRRANWWKIIPGGEYTGLVCLVRPVVPQLDRLEARFLINEWFATDDVDTVHMATQYVMGVLPFEILLDWLQQRHPEIAEQVEAEELAEAE